MISGYRIWTLNQPINKKLDKSPKRFQANKENYKTLGTFVINFLMSEPSVFPACAY